MIKAVDTCRLTALIDRNGNASLSYDGDKLTALDNVAGRRVEFDVEIRKEQGKVNGNL